MSIRPGISVSSGSSIELVGVVGDRRVGADGGDPVALDADVAGIDHVAGVDVEHAGRVEHDHLRFGHGSPFVAVRSRSSYSSANVGLVGRAWQVRIHPSATSSGVSALLTRIVTVPSLTSAMQVAQLPCSHGNGGFEEARRGRVEHGVALDVFERRGVCA